ncbi:hypothetical protein CFK37_17875 [Virgibacillus phasianinus]|uniref:Uncharacterized protein n=1 Tax=Virgibacillus phasianinus TaxID=2017483 RepID=A0A220U820_9BACI|nr:hypothetical protein [Virgibacillus phasianinus]ASK63893.1 hypothetical protein CFK37_17875 [Virgibacillus phasianinus]
MHKTYSKWSVILSITCALTIFVSYAIAPRQPEGVMVVLIQVLFFTSIVTGLLSLIFSFIGFKKKEKGFLKMVSPIIIILILITFIISFIALAISFL